MFDLEQAVAAWRQAMRAGGIQSPEVLAELEGHLRETIQALTAGGRPEREAFEAAVAQVGAAPLLRREFGRAHGVAGWWEARRYPVLGLMWLAFCAIHLLGLLWMLWSIAGFSHRPSALSGLDGQLHKFIPVFAFALLMSALYVRGIFAGVQLGRGNLRGRRFLRLLALLEVIGNVSGMIAGYYNHPLTVLCLFLGLASLWYLRPPQGESLATR